MAMIKNKSFFVILFMALLVVPFGIFNPQDAFAAQFGRPTSDISNAGSWSDTSGGGELFDELDETSSDDGTTIVTSKNKPATTDTFEVGLGTLSDPDSDTGHIVRYSANKAQGAQTLTIHCDLYQGANLVRTDTTHELTGSGWQSFSYTLTNGEANGISNYGDLRVRCIPETGGGGGQPAVAEVSWIELEIPDAPQPAYVLDQLDVYESSSSTLGSGTAICLTVDLENSSACGTDLVEGSTYRFEVQVRNDGAAAGTPTEMRMRNVVGTNDVFGATPTFGNAGCSTNTDWTASAVSVDIVVSSGSTCTISASSTEKFWFIVTLDNDAADETGDFFITDGSINDGSTETSFTVVSGATQSYTVTTLDIYNSKSTTLNSGTPICTAVSLTTPSTCNGIMLVGGSYRFEVTVSEDNGVDGTPTTLDIDSAVGNFDLVGSIVEAQILDSGCETNTDWNAVIVSTDIRATSGTGCTINSGSADFWIMLRIHSDAGGAVQPTVTFTIDDGTVSDTSTVTTFIVDNILE